MSHPENDSPCPCGTGLAFAWCCQPYLQGRLIPLSAEALMRSRYAAFVGQDADYLRQSWHPTTRPATLDLHDQAEIVWLGLEILASQGGQAEDSRGEVEFVARFSAAGKEHRLHERSVFFKENGRWFYLDGRIDPGRKPVEREKVGRNEPCPCGSGGKYKKCCMGR
ncbi:YchJ family protein [Thiovibrio sp. JS02]